MLEKNIKKEEKPPFYIINFKFLVVLIFLVLFLSGYYFLIKPERSESQSLAIELNNLTSDKELSLQQLKATRETITAYENISSYDREKINQILPDGPDEANFYVNLESLIQLSGATLNNLTLQTQEMKTKKPLLKNKGESVEPISKIGENIGFIDLTFDLADMSYGKLKNLLNLVENNIRLLDIVSLSFAPGDSGTLNLGLHSYYFSVAKTKPDENIAQSAAAEEL